MTFIGVTGSSAKTTTKELIAAMLSTRLKGQRTGGTLKYGGGTGWPMYMWLK